MFNALIIDDDPIQLRIAELLIKRSASFSELASYSEADQALRFLEDQVDDCQSLPDVILLDLNMPVVDGWDFLEVFETFYKKLEKQIRIFIVTSSVDEKDKLRAQEYSTVKGFISKPLSPDIIRSTC